MKTDLPKHGLAESTVKFLWMFKEDIKQQTQKYLEETKKTEKEELQDLLTKSLSQVFHKRGIPNIGIDISLLTKGSGLIESTLVNHPLLSMLTAFLGKSPKDITDFLYKALSFATKGTGLEFLPRILMFDKTYKDFVEKFGKKYAKLLSLYEKSTKAYNNLIAKSQKIVYETKEVIETTQERIISDSQAFKKTLLSAFAPVHIVELFEPLFNKAVEKTKEWASSLFKKTGSLLWKNAIQPLLAKTGLTALTKIIDKKLGKSLQLPPEFTKFLQENRNLIKKLDKFLTGLQALGYTNKQLNFAHKIIKASLNQPQTLTQEDVEAVKETAGTVGKQVKYSYLKAKHKLLRRPITVTQTETGEIVEQVTDFEKVEQEARKTAKSGSVFKPLILAGTSIAGLFTLSKLWKREKDEQSKQIDKLSAEVKRIREIEEKQHKEGNKFRNFLQWMLIGVSTALTNLLTFVKGGVVNTLESVKDILLEVAGGLLALTKLKKLKDIFKLGKATEEAVKGAEVASKVEQAGKLSKFVKFGGNALKVVGRALDVVGVGLVGYDLYKNYKKFGTVGESVKETFFNKEDLLSSTANSAVVGSTIGAALGSVIPGAGTAAGGLIGGLIGAGIGLAGSLIRRFTHKSPEEQFREQLKRFTFHNVATGKGYSSDVKLSGYFDPDFLNVIGPTIKFESGGKIDAINKREWSFGLFQIHDLKALKTLAKLMLPFVNTQIDRQLLLQALKSNDRKTIVQALADVTRRYPATSEFMQLKVIHELYWKPIKTYLISIGRTNPNLEAVVFDAAIQMGPQTAINMLKDVIRSNNLNTLSDNQLIKQFTEIRVNKLGEIARRKNIPIDITRPVELEQLALQNKIVQNAQQRAEAKTNSQPPIVVNNINQPVTTVNNQTTTNSSNVVSPNQASSKPLFVKHYTDLLDVL